MGFKKDTYHSNGMFKGAPASAFKKAKQLRKHMTPPEKKLWGVLKNKKLNGYKFRRQHPIHLFIVDFYCHERCLVLEVDGGYHRESRQIAKDNQRTALLKFQGLSVLRFTNKEVLTSLQMVIGKIKDSLEHPVIQH